MKKNIYISLPKNISYSVFEALKIHVNVLEKVDRNIIYLSRNPDLIDKRIIYFNNTIELIKFLRKQEKGLFYGITVFELFIGFISNLFNNKKTLIFWVQGLIDKEDYFSRKSKLRYLVFRFLLKQSISIADKLVVVTKTMFDVLVKQYNCKADKKYLIINCNSRVNYNNSEKEKHSLCYIGGLSKWQNVDKALIFFNSLSKISSKYSLYIATFDHEEILKMIDNHIDDNYRSKVKLLKIKQASEVENFLSKMEYGFLIRDNVLLNNVASPIKLAEYLACGVHPILSESLLEFKPLIQNSKAGIIIENSNFDEAIKKLLIHRQNPNIAVNLYKECFERISLEKDVDAFFN